MGSQLTTSRLPFAWLLLLATALAPALAWSQDNAPNRKTGFVIEVPVPLTHQDSIELLAKLERLAGDATLDSRTDVVLRYDSQSDGGDATAFEDALRIARAVTGDRLRTLRVISMVEGKILGHSVLPILASDSLVMGEAGVLGDASASESTSDETVVLTYKGIAARRALFPDALVDALIRPDVELAWVTKVGGGKEFSSGQDLVKLRETGEVLSEKVWSAAGVPAHLSASQLREARIAAGIVPSLEKAAELFDLAELKPVDDRTLTGTRKGVLLDVTGSISRNRVTRWQSNLIGTLDADGINTWVINIDSDGGDLIQSANVCGILSQPEPPIDVAVGYLSNEARADSALIALSCKPLFMNPEATLGGTGADEISLEELDEQDELIELIARRTKRPSGLIRGLLCPELEVYRYINKKTGQIKYSTEDDLVMSADDPELERTRWERDTVVALSEGLSASEAIELGLADATCESLEIACQKVGLSSVPDPVSDRGLVRFIERLGQSRGLMMILLLMGFMALSAEMNAPGLGGPGFLAVVCFGLFFWMNYLAGTAEWLELVLLILGIGCILAEVLVLPGFGVFGIGGILMTIAAIVLMSQTFVLPQNSYQLTEITKGLWAAIGGLFGLIGGFFLMRQLFPHVPLFRHLIMEAPDAAAIDEAERLADYSSLLNQTGITTTPLRPSGKAKFGDDILQVVSEGSMIEKGKPVTVIEVQGAKVVVEA